MSTIQSTSCENNPDSVSTQRRMGAMALTSVMSFSMSAVVATNPLIFCLAQITHTLAMTLFLDLLQLRDISWDHIRFRKSFCFLRALALVAGAFTLHTIAFQLLSTWGVWQTMAIYRLGSVPFQAITCLPIVVGCVGYLRPQPSFDKTCKPLTPLD